jgi:hypothetical protein
MWIVWLIYWCMENVLDVPKTFVCPEKFLDT